MNAGLALLLFVAINTLMGMFFLSRQMRTFAVFSFATASFVLPLFFLVQALTA